MAIFAATCSNSFAQLDISFTASEHGSGYNISCFGGNDGWITVSVTGGTPPYTYAWSNGETGTTISNLVASYYSVVVTDNLGAIIEGGLNLSEPRKVETELTSPVYYERYNVSCWHCSNGSIQATVTGGVEPYSFSWQDGTPSNPIITQNRANIGGGIFIVEVTDNNGCLSKANITLLEPERNVWAMNGNTDNNPLMHYLGTANNTDMVFKTNGTERMRLNADGSMNVSGNLSLQSLANPNRPNNIPIEITAAGLIVAATPPPCPPICPVFSCGFSPEWDIWHYTQCDIYTNNNVGIGFSLADFSNGMQILARLDVNGGAIIRNDLRVGTDYIPIGYKLAVDGKIIATEVKVKLRNAWPDFVFENDYKKMSLKELEDYILKNKHLPNMPSAKEIKNADGFEIGNLQMQMLQTDEVYSLYIIDLQKQIDELKKEIAELKQLLKK